MASVTFHDPTSAKKRRLPRRCAPRNDNRFHINRQSPLTQITLTGCRFWNTPNISRLLYLSLVLAIISTCCGIEVAKAPKPVHDVAITNISAPSACKQGDKIPIKITVNNQGTQREMFRVVLTEETSGKGIASKEVTLAKGWKDGSEGVADQTFTCPDAGVSTFGDQFALGDVDNDGCDDLLVGAPRGNDLTGIAYLYYGRTAMGKSPDMIFVGENSGDYYTKSNHVADIPSGHLFANIPLGDYFGAGGCLDDINGDGYDDVIIGAPGYGRFQGRVYVYLGGPNRDRKVDLVLDGEPGTLGGFGWFMAVGDANGDGYGDIFVSAQWIKNYTGRVYLYYGGPNIDSVADKIFDGEKPGTHFGYNISAGGDINNDGYCDVLIGAEHEKKGPHYVDSNGPGSAYVYYGGRDMDTECDKVFRGESNRDRFGNEVEICNIDGDGFADVIIGAPDGGAGHVGRAYLYWGAADMDIDADWVTTGEGLGSGHGTNAKLADFNNDNYVDLLVGAYSYPDKTNRGRCYIYHGGPGRSIDKVADHVLDGEPGHEGRFGNYLATGDVNGDKYSDIVVSGWGYNNGQGKVYLYYGPFSNDADITLNWDTTNVTPGRHTLKASIAPVSREEDITDNTMAVTIEVKGLSKTVGTPRELNQQ